MCFNPIFFILFVGDPASISERVCNNTGNWFLWMLLKRFLLVFSKTLLHHLLHVISRFLFFPFLSIESERINSCRFTPSHKQECNKCFLSTGPRLCSIRLTRFLFLTAVSFEVGSGPCSTRALVLTRVPPHCSLPQMCIPASLPKCQLQEPYVPTVTQSFDFMIYYALTLPLDYNRRLFTGHPWDDSGFTHWAARHNLQPGPPVPTDIWRGFFTLSQHLSQRGVQTALVPARGSVCVHNQEWESSLGRRHKLWLQLDLP